MRFLDIPAKITGRRRDHRSAPMQVTVSDVDSRVVRLNCVVNDRDIGSCGRSSSFGDGSTPVTGVTDVLELSGFVSPNSRNTVEVTATDEVGNESTISYSWHVDWDSPVVKPGRLPTRTTKRRIRWSVSATDRPANVDYVEFRMRVGRGRWVTRPAWKVYGDRKPSITVPLARRKATTVSARAMDRVGNMSGWVSKTALRR